MHMQGSDAKYHRQKASKRFQPGFVHMLLGLLACVMFLGVCAAISTPQQNPQVSNAPQEKKPHPPLAGKSCVDCHEQNVSSTVRCLVAKEPLCVLCHDIPDAGGTSRLVIAASPLCFKCHAKEKFKNSFNHGPFVFGACVACHNPHGGNEPRMLRISGRQLCLTCHRDMDTRFTNARFRHQALATGCTECHSPHSSEQHYELKAAVPVLCAKCHEKTTHEQETAKVKHSPVTEAPACMNCHNPHLSENDHLLLSEEPDTCLRCHDEPIKIGQNELEPMGQLLAANPRQHGPMQSKECSGCHKSHGSSNFRLLTDEYPKGFYTPFQESKYALCFRCHESTLVKEERTATLTGFRDGDRNLHFVHVNKVPEGRACGLCHEPHASTLPKHIRVSVPFGNWNMPIGFSQTENGGSCAPGCHELKKYERKAG
jgi:predicted CXXCH cytochrome family protein